MNLIISEFGELVQDSEMTDATLSEHGNKIMKQYALKKIDILKLSITGWFEAIFAILFFIMVYFYKKSPIFYIILSAILGIILEV